MNVSWFENRERQKRLPRGYLAPERSADEEFGISGWLVALAFPVKP
jgi:hypothetical protein